MPQDPVDTDVSEFAQSLGLLVRRLRSAAALHGLSLTESSVMARLARDGPATTADLARAEGMKPQSMGTTIAALEEAGMVQRKPHPTDGRQINIELTPKGAAIRQSTRQTKRSWLAQAMGQLTETERQTLFEAGRIITRLVENEAS